MIVKCQSCIFANISCNRVNSCKYTLNRFGVIECEPNIYKKTIVSAVHQQELQERRKLLKNLG